MMDDSAYSTITVAALSAGRNTTNVTRYGHDNLGRIGGDTVVRLMINYARSLRRECHGSRECLGILLLPRGCPERM